ncbi:hemerythrin domain-containing protein [uncultured Streptomyces sp.]|uniref:hemerythrin domain-containing protein n=1 Tax=uncultured Streptomyces sp. TaxID=174707 RepID=UPI0026293654|nr:hemerythrin domain-containing protein [uncultured Streptomyces sp.]
MCHYCGCRDIPLIKDFIAEHERALHAAEEALRALERKDPDRAHAWIATMEAELEAHWQGEEEGLFLVMRGDPEYAAYIDVLEREHIELAALLPRLDFRREEDVEAFRAAVQELYDHISREENGLFPASLTALSGDDWNTSMDAWRRAHPRETLAR